MIEKEKDMIEQDSLPDPEDDMTSREDALTDEPLGAEEVAPAEDISMEEPLAEEAAPALEEDLAAEEAPAPKAEPEPIAEPAPVSEPVEEAPQKEVPSYGVPQPLFEDFIPNDFSMNGAAPAEEKPVDAAKAAKEAKAAAAAAKQAEKEAAKEAKRLAKEEKKKAKAQPAPQEEVMDLEEKSEGDIVPEDATPAEAPVAPPASIAKAAPEPVIAAVPVPVEEAAEEEPAPAPKKKKKDKKKHSKQAAEATEDLPAEAEGETEPQLSKAELRAIAYENKLRKKYKLTKDDLLSENHVIPGFVIAKGENIVRFYHCLRRGAGTVCLTNKRLLINAGERSEVEVDKVSGVKFCKYTQFSFFKLFFWLLFFGLGGFLIALPFIKSKIGIPYIADHWIDWFSPVFFSHGVFFVLLSLLFFLKIIRKSFYFYIYARQDTPFLEAKNRFYAKKEKKGLVYKFLVSKAANESEKAARELGALILEVKAGRYDY